MSRSLVAGFVLAALGACQLESGTTPPSSRAGSETIERKLEIPGRIYQRELDNGMTLVVVPDSMAHLVQFDVRHQVGSREDPSDARGMAHLVEHLMLQLPADGKDSSAPSVFDLSTLLGASFNAVTTPDETHYMHRGPAGQLRRYMEFAAGRLDFECAALEPEQFERERSVVQNEYRTRGRGGPNLRATIDALLFAEGHPYRNVNRQDDDSIAGIDREQACAWAKQYYTTRRTRVVVTGDVDPKEVFAMAEQTLGRVERTYSHPRASFPSRSVEGGRTTLSWPAERSHAFLVFPAPTRHDELYINHLVTTHRALMAASFCAHASDCGALEVDLIEFGGKEDPYVALSITPAEGVPIDEAVADTLASIEEMFYEGDNPYGHKALFDLSRQGVRLQLLRRVAQLGARAFLFADYLEEGKPSWHQADFADLDSLFVSQSDAYGRSVFTRKLARQVIIRPNGQVGTFAEAIEGATDDAPHPRSTALDVQLIREAEQPLELGSLKDRESRRTKVYEADNGMTIVLAPNTLYPVVQARVVVHAGDAAAAPVMGIADLAADARELPRNDDRMRAIANTWLSGTLSFPTAVGSMSSSTRGSGLSIYVDHLIEGLSTWIRKTGVDKEAVEGWATRQRETLDDPRILASRRAFALLEAELYGSDHPLSVHDATVADELQAVEASAVWNFRRDHYRSKNSTLVVTGGFYPHEIAPLVARHFGSRTLGAWAQKGPSRETRLPAIPRRNEPIALSFADPARSRLHVGAYFAQRPEDITAYLQTLIARDMLEQAMLSLRAREGLTYGVQATFDANWPRVRLSGSFDAEKAPNAMRSFLRAHEMLFEADTFARSFAIARRRLVLDLFALSGDVDALAEHHETMAALQLGHFPPTQLARLVAELDLASQRELMQGCFSPDQAVFMLQGPPAALAALEGLEGLPAIREVEAMPAPEPPEPVWGGLSEDGEVSM